MPKATSPIITGTTSVVVRLRPFMAPNFVLPENRENSTISLKDIAADTLSLLCDQFRKDVFEKAGKTDPNLQCKVQR